MDAPSVAPRALGDVKHVPHDTDTPSTADHMRILVAEDDPVNSKIIKKRLEKFGHEVYLTVNGEECLSAYIEKTELFDIVLMDMQVGHLIADYPTDLHLLNIDLDAHCGRPRLSQHDSLI